MSSLPLSHQSRSTLSPVVTAAALATLAALAPAATVTKDPSGTDLSSSTSWIGGVAPTSTDTAAFTNPSLGGPLTLSSAANWGGLFDDGSTGTINLSGASLTLTGGQTVSGVANSGFYLSGNSVGTPSAPTTIANNVVLAASQTWSVASGEGALFTGIVSGNAALTKNLAGTLVLRGANTYSGGTVLAGGVVGVQNAAALGTGSVSVTGNSTIANNGFTVANNIGINNGATLTLTGVAGTAATGGGSTNVYSNIYSGVISGAGAVRANSYALLTGVNTYTGGTTVGGFLLGINSDTSLGAVPASVQAANITLGGGTLSNYTTAYTSGIVLNANRGVTLTANSTLDVGGGSVATPGLTVNGVITGGFALAKNAGGVLGLAAANTYTGGTTINSGTIAFNNANALGSGAITVAAAANNSAITVASGNTSFLAYNGTASSVALANNIALPTSPTTVVYTLSQTGGLSQSVSYNGIISGGNSFTTLQINTQTGSDGTSVTALNGVNTFAGTVALNRGSLLIGNASALGTAALAVGTNVNPGTTANGVTYGNVTFTAPMTLANNIAVNTGNDSFYNAAANPVTLSGVVSGATFQKIGNGTLTLTGTNTTTGAANVNAGTLQIGSGGSAGLLATASGITVASGANLTINRGDAVSQGTVSASTAVIPAAAITGFGSLTQAGTGTLTLTAANTYGGGTTINAGNVAISNAGGLGSGPVTVNSGASSASTAASANTAFLSVTSTNSVAVVNAISLPTPASLTYYTLSKSGSATNLTLNGNLSGGNANTWLMFNTPNSGDGSTRLILNGNNAGYAGNIRVNRGAITVGNANALGSGQLAMQTNGGNANGTLQFGGAFTLANPITLRSGGGGDPTISTNGFDVTLSGVLSSGVIPGSSTAGSAAGLTKIGAGTLTVSAVNTYTGSTNVNTGMLALSSATSNNIASSPQMNVASGATLNVSGITANGGFVVAANQVLAGSGTVSGSTTVGPAATITAGTGATAASTPGTLTTDGQTWSGGVSAASRGNYAAKFAANTSAGSGWDLLSITSLTLNATASTQFGLTLLKTTIGTFTATTGVPYTIAHANGLTINGATINTTTAGTEITNLFALDTNGLGLATGDSVMVSYAGSSASGYDLQVTMQSAPEPTTAALVALGGSAVLGRRRRRAACVT